MTGQIHPATDLILRVSKYMEAAALKVWQAYQYAPDPGDMLLAIRPGTSTIRFERPWTKMEDDFLKVCGKEIAKIQEILTASGEVFPPSCYPIDILIKPERFLGLQGPMVKSEIKGLSFAGQDICGIGHDLDRAMTRRVKIEVEVSRMMQPEKLSDLRTFMILDSGSGNETDLVTGYVQASCHENAAIKAVAARCDEAAIEKIASGEPVDLPEYLARLKVVDTSTPTLGQIFRLADKVQDEPAMSL